MAFSGATGASQITLWALRVILKRVCRHYWHRAGGPNSYKQNCRLTKPNLSPANAFPCSVEGICGVGRKVRNARMHAAHRQPLFSRDAHPTRRAEMLHHRARRNATQSTISLTNIYETQTRTPNHVQDVVGTTIHQKTRQTTKQQNIHSSRVRSAMSVVQGRH